MMTTVSIDTVGIASDAVMGCEGQGNGQVAPGEAVSLFQQSLADQTVENAALGEMVRFAMVSVGETLVKLDPKLPPLPQQVESNAALATELTAATAVVGEALVKLDPNAAAATVVEPVADGTEAVNLQLPPLPQQIESNVALATELTAATAVVGEALVKLDPNAAATTVVGPVADGTEAVPPQLPPLPQQVESNAALATELTAATEVVGETLAKLDSNTVAPAVELPAATTVVGETLAKLDPNAAVATVAEPVADGTEDVPPLLEETPAAQPDEPEVTAEALVAAGVTPTVTAPAEGAATATPTIIAPVDVVRVQSSEAVTPVAVLVQAAEAVADTLLVTPGLLRGQGEVVVQLRPDVLEGTEVKIAVTGRQLDVVFQPQTVDMAVMIENCRSQLVQHLAAKIVSFNVSVDVRKKKEIA